MRPDNREEAQSMRKPPTPKQYVQLRLPFEPSARERLSMLPSPGAHYLTFTRPNKEGRE